MTDQADRPAQGAKVVIPVIHESLTLTRERVDAGGLRLRKLVHEEPARVERCGSREELEVTRIAVGRDLDVPVGIRQDGEVTIIPVLAERLVTRVQLVLVEELHVRRTRRTAAEPLDVVLRREEILVDRLDPVAGERSTSSTDIHRKENTMQTIIATFADTATAQTAVDRLVAQGFTRAQVHLQAASDATPEAANETAAAKSPGVAGMGAMPASAAPTEYGAATAAPSTLTGAPEETQSPGRRSFLTGVENFFSSLFADTSDAHAGHYAEAVRRGGAVVTVDATTEGELDKARSLMGDLGPIDVEESAKQWKHQGWTGFDPSAEFDPTGPQDFHRRSVPVVQEELQVGKREIDAGGLRVIKRLSTTPVSELVKLREERATIERRPVDRAATAADLDAFEEGTIELRETTEQAVVGKTARVVEEVVVGTQVTERTETVSDTVRRTDVDVERIPGETPRETGSSAGTGTAASDNLRR